MLCRPPRIPREPGTYILLLTVEVHHAVRVDRRGARIVVLKPGVYVYVGSAWGAGGLAARVERHMRVRRVKRLHWHIDRILESEYVAVEGVAYAVGCRAETRLANILSETPGAAPVPGVGASDDPEQDTHLFALGLDLDEAARLVVTCFNRVCSGVQLQLGLRCRPWRLRGSRPP